MHGRSMSFPIGDLRNPTPMFVQGLCPGGWDMRYGESIPKRGIAKDLEQGQRFFAKYVAQRLCPNIIRFQPMPPGSWAALDN